MQRYAVGLDLGGTNLKGGIIKENGEVFEYKIIQSEPKKGPEHLVNILIQMSETLLNKAKEMGIEVSGVGVVTPGIIDPEFGGLTGGADNLPRWRKTPFMKMMYSKLKIPIFAHNDVTATVLGEAKYGAGYGVKNFIMASFGTGIGGGIVLNGKLYSGATGYAGEIGHIAVHSGGIKCSCGISGCWEEYASIRGIVRIANSILKKENYKNSILLKEINEKGITPELIFEAARKKDPAALDIVDEIGNQTAIGIGGLINIFNPELFIVGGGISLGGEIYIQSIKKHLPEWTLKDSLMAVRVEPAQLKITAGIIGASVLVFDNINRFGD